MKGAKKTAVIGLAAAVILAVVLILLLRDSGGEPGREGLLVVHEINTSDVVQIIIDNGGAENVLVKNDGIWFFEDGVTEADRLAVESALTQLSYLYAADVVPEGGSMDLGTFGLDPPRLSVELVLNDGTSEKILFGVFTTDRNYCYFMKYGHSDVYLLSIINYEQIESGLTRLTDLSLRIDPASLEVIAFTRENGLAFELFLIGEDERVGNERWMLYAPFSAVASDKLAALVEALLTPPRLASFAGAEVKPEHGIGSGGLFRAADKEGRVVSLSIGTRAEDGSYYCTAAGKEGVFTLYPAFEELFRIDIGNCVQRSILPLDPNTIRSFTLEAEGKTLDFDAEAGTLNGRALTEEGIIKLFTEIAAVTFDGLTDMGAAGGAGTGGFYIGGEKVVSFSAYKDDYYAVSSFGGDAAVYIRKEKLVELIVENS